MANSFRAYRQLERFLFQGIPEYPESVYERESNPNVAKRRTGEALDSENYYLEPTADDKLIATITYRYDTNQVIIIRQDEKSTD